MAPEKRKTEITVSEYDEDGEKISSEKVKLNGDQYSKYQREYGQQYALMAAALMASDYYDELSDSDKVKAFQEIESLADEYGKLAAGVGYVLEPGSLDNKLYYLTQNGIPAAEAYAARLLYRQLNRDESISPTDRYERFRTWVYGNEEWTKKEQALVIDTLGKFSSGFVVDSENYDELLSYGSISAELAGSITEGIRAIKPLAGHETVTDNQRYEYILSRKDLTGEQRNDALDAYIPSGSRAKYEGWTGTTKVDGKTIRSGISTEQYVRIQLAISELKPTGGNKGVSEAQRLTAIANFPGLTDKQRYSLMVCAETSYEEGSDNTSGEAWRKRLYGAQEAGISAGAFMKVYTDTSSFDAKDENGETVNGLKKKRIAKYLRGTLLLTDYQKGYIWTMFYEKSTWDGWKYE